MSDGSDRRPDGDADDGGADGNDGHGGADDGPTAAEADDGPTAAEADDGPTAAEADDGPTAADPERAALLRETAEDVRTRGDDRSEQVAAFLYRVSDLYDPEEDRTPASIYRNMRTILRVKERGTLSRDPGGEDDSGSG